MSGGVDLIQEKGINIDLVIQQDLLSLIGFEVSHRISLRKGKFKPFASRSMSEGFGGGKV